MERTGPILVAVDGRASPVPPDDVRRLAGSLRLRFPGRDAVVLVAGWGGAGIALRAPETAGDVPPPGHPPPPPLTGGGIPGPESTMGALLREMDRRGAAAAAMLSGDVHDATQDWLGALLAPLLDEGFDYACPAYLRHKAEATLNTGVVYPFTRALYGWRLRQPLGGEAALSLPLARKLLSDPDWRRDPAQAGSDAWVVAKVLTGDARACQSWLGAWPGASGGPREDASLALGRVLGLVFREAERHAERWQRVEGSRPVVTFGAPGALDGEVPRVSVDRLVATFQLGQRELGAVWGLVLPPASLLALSRAAAMPAASFRLDDGLWARVVYDFAVAHYTRVVERRQLLLSMTPLYLGWVASFLNEAGPLGAGAAEERVEALCAAFEREKRYLISRWRWPDTFNP
jgi:hypothetical protein